MYERAAARSGGAIAIGVRGHLAISFSLTINSRQRTHVTCTCRRPTAIDDPAISGRPGPESGRKRGATVVPAKSGLKQSSQERESKGSNTYGRERKRERISSTLHTYSRVMPHRNPHRSPLTPLAVV
eukprot:scaffold7976_cov105-Isochrysis_galbana.AAC.4